MPDAKSFGLPQELVAINPVKAADLVSVHFSEEVRPIIDKLEVKWPPPSKLHWLWALYSSV